MMRNKKACAKRLISRGFSLLELIIVIAIISILFLVTRPLVSSLAGRDDVGNSATELQMLLDFAREQAKARQTYVWVVFGLGNTAIGGNLLSAVVLGSLDGTSNSASNNLTQLSKRMSLPDIVLVNVDQLKLSTQNLLPQPRGVNLTEQPTHFNYSSGSINHQRFITFSPRGEVLSLANPNASDGFEPIFDIGLRKSRGAAAPAPDADDAGIIIYGGSGRSVVIRQ